MFTNSPFKKQLNGKTTLHRVIGYFADWTAILLSGVLAFDLRFDFDIPASLHYPMELALGIWFVGQSLALIVGRLDRGNWRYTSAYDAFRLVLALSVSCVMGGGLILALLGAWGIPRSAYILDWMLCCFLTLGSRLAVRVLKTARQSRRNEGDRKRTLIYGAGSAGLALLWEIRQNNALNCWVVGFIDDDPSKRSLILQGKRVLGTGEDLKAIVRDNGVERLLIAIPSASGPQMVRILKCATDAGVKYKMVPGLGDLIENQEFDKQLKDVSVEDLLGRKPVHLDQESIRGRIQGKVVMVTGAAGSIGSEICRQIARFDPLAIVGFDEAETPLFQIDRELKRKFPHLVFHPEIGNITHPESLQRAMQRHQPSILYHAAAYKHVPMMERHVFAAVENNIFGTWYTAQAAINNCVESFVMISTDKAVRPTSMMGATKRVAELLICALQKESGTKFVAVRFGNVLGSNGSVVPIFKEQIAAGGPVTVTHPDMCRYFMTIPEASQLVLQAFSIGMGGEVFVLDMGNPVKIVDLARNLILLSGLQPDDEIRIHFTGLRPGEKMFEELNLQDECLLVTSHPQIRSYVHSFDLTAKQMKEHLKELQQIIKAQDVGLLLLLLKELIPDYNPGSQLLHAALSTPLSHPDPIARATPRKSAETSLPVELIPAARLN